MTLPLPPKSSFFCNFLLDESRAGVERKRVVGRRGSIPASPLYGIVEVFNGSFNLGVGL
jgi:hypothetical protein